MFSLSIDVRVGFVAYLCVDFSVKFYYIFQSFQTPEVGMYAMTKAAMDMFTKCLAMGKNIVSPCHFRENLYNVVQPRRWYMYNLINSEHTLNLTYTTHLSAL